MIFIDSGAFLGRFVVRDQHHEKAMVGCAKLASGVHRLFTSSFVVDETITLLARKTSHLFAADRAREILSSRELTILRPGVQDEWDALARFEKLADQAVSFTDCVSFALMSRHRISHAFGFDRHFRFAGFETWPETL